MRLGHRTRLSWLAVTAATSVLASCAASSATATPMFLGLGDLPGGIFSSSATGVSADGLVVVGRSLSRGPIGPSSGDEAFRWTMSGGMVGLGDLPGGSTASAARGISADGLVIVGEGISGSGTEAFRWSSGGGMTGLGDLPGGSFSSLAYGTSADGSVIVGGGSAFRREAFRWSQSGGIDALGFLAGDDRSTAAGVSADGTVVVGNSGVGKQAFRWTAAEGMVSLGNLLGSAPFIGDSGATGVAADGAYSGPS